jgi:predicted DCC family thiol-disulfide oxidoreductase YuxK
MTTDHTTEPGLGWVLYDGNCGICRQLAQRWGPTLGGLGLAVAPLQTPWVAQRTGLPLDQLTAEVRLLYNDGRLVSGAEVYRHIFRRIWWTFPLYFLSIIPVGRQVFDLSYRAFARNRMRISDSCALP